MAVLAGTNTVTPLAELNCSQRAGWPHVTISTGAADFVFRTEATLRLEI